MFKGGSNGALALGIVIGGAFAVFAVVWLIGLNYCPETPCNYDYKHSHGPTDGPTQHQGWIPRPNLPNYTLQAEPQFSEGYPQEYEYADLQAQENMARATNWIAWFALFSSITAGAGVILLVRNLNVTREVGRDQSRAYLDVNSVSFNWGGKRMDNPRFSIAVRNTGATPAKWYQIRTDYLFEKHAGDRLNGDIKRFSDLNLQARFSGKWSGIGGGESGLTMMGPKIRSVDEFKKCLFERKSMMADRAMPTHSVCVFGEIKYCTAFDEIYTSQFFFGATWLEPFQGDKTEEISTDSSGIKTSISEWSETPQHLSRWPMEMDVYKAERG